MHGVQSSIHQATEKSLSGFCVVEMNFYIVPGGLYQTQQKMVKKIPAEKPNSASSRTSRPGETAPLKSRTLYEESKRSSLETPKNLSFNEPSQAGVTAAPGCPRCVSKLSESHISTLADDKELNQGSITISSSALRERDHDRRTSLFPNSFDVRLDRRKSFNMGRKASYSQVPTASFSSQPPPGAVSVRPELFSHVGNSQDSSRLQIPKFRTITDLSVLNKESLIRKNFYNPSYISTRYNNFLQILSEHHLSDSLNYAAVREHSLMKFISRHDISKQEREKITYVKAKGDIRYYEGLISYELLRCRTFLRWLIRLQSKEDPNQTCIISCEELLQLNFNNYVQFLLNLPNVLPVAPENLDEILAKHYQFRSFFSEMSSALYSLRKAGYADDMPTSISDVEILLETTSRVSNEFILLEKYAIHILVKLNHNFIIENRIVSHLFSLFDLNMKLERMESLKVLHFNTYFSAQYSWYMAISMPFIRVFEANIYGEDPAIVSSFDTYREQLAATTESRKNFKDSDKCLYEDFFSRLKVKDFELFSKWSGKDLVDLQRSSSEKCVGNALDKGCHDFQFKPPNFEYFTNSLLTLESETFHVIHSRDISLQLSPTNFKVILAEFYRLLKKGGVLELPLFKPDDMYIRDLAKLRYLKLQDQTKFMDLEDAQAFEFKPNLMESLLEELARIFGAKNVKFTSVLLSSKNDMSNFLIKHSVMSAYEIHGEVDYFCSRFADEANTDIKENEFLHYYFYIRAEKS